VPKTKLLLYLKQLSRERWQSEAISPNQGEEPPDTGGGRFFSLDAFWSSGHALAPLALGRFLSSALGLCGVSCMI